MVRLATTRHTIATSCAHPLFHIFPSCGAVFDKRRRFQHDFAHTLLASPFSYIEAIPASIPASLYTCLPFFCYVGAGPPLNGPNTLCGLTGVCKINARQCYMPLSLSLRLLAPSFSKPVRPSVRSLTKKTPDLVKICLARPSPLYVGGGRCASPYSHLHRSTGVYFVANTCIVCCFRKYCRAYVYKL